MEKIKIENDIINNVINHLNNTLEELLIIGLKIKGFDFKNRFEIEEFIKSNCRCEDRFDIKQRTYFVNDIPFFLHLYGFDFNDLDIKDNNFNFNYGYYAFL